MPFHHFRIVSTWQILPDILMELMMNKHHMIILALILTIQYDYANGASRTRDWHYPLLVNSPSMPPTYKDPIGGDRSTLVAAGVPPPPLYCAYPPPAKPTTPNPPPPAAASPGAAVPPVSPPSITPAWRPPAKSPPYPGLWCVANPTVESAEVQAAMDYACGSGADCDMAAPGGPCYLPDTLMAHASFAFNSYWQRTKVAGGTCDFAGAAMLITKDPSYDDCRYVYM